MGNSESEPIGLSPIEFVSNYCKMRVVGTLKQRKSLIVGANRDGLIGFLLRVKSQVAIDFNLRMTVGRGGSPCYF